MYTAIPESRKSAVDGDDFTFCVDLSQNLGYDVFMVCPFHRQFQWPLNPDIAGLPDSVQPPATKSRVMFRWKNLIQCLNIDNIWGWYWLL